MPHERASGEGSRSLKKLTRADSTARLSRAERNQKAIASFQMLEHEADIVVIDALDK